MVDEEYIEELVDKSENENTRNGTEYWKKVFKEIQWYCPCVIM